MAFGADAMMAIAKFEYKKDRWANHAVSVNFRRASAMISYGSLRGGDYVNPAFFYKLPDGVTIFSKQRYIKHETLPPWYE